LIGPNGAGKSTLLRTLAAMQAPISGQVLLDGHDVRYLSSIKRARLLSVVLTQRVDVGILSAYSLVTLGRYPYTDWSGALSEHDEQIVQWAIESVGATKLAHRNIGELSDGERQKVMIARALAQEPALMLLDEPTAFLDLPRRVEIMQVLRHLAHDTGRAILLSTHDLDLALRSADRIWLLPENSPMQTGAPEDLILSGAFETAFHSQGVTFDRESGAFRIHTEHKTEIALAGDGVYGIWTRRALERAGFIVKQFSHHDDDLCVEIMRYGDETHWQLRSENKTQVFDTIHELISGLHFD
jgi:iron complex transport system ATP-binding protein